MLASQRPCAQRVWLAGALGLGLAVGVSHGPQVEAIMVRQTLAERAQEADYIARGTVVDQRSRLTRVKGIRLISTVVRLRVHQCLKALGDEPPAELEIHVPGGAVGDLAMHVADSPQFRTREEVIVLLKHLRGSACQLVEGRLGKYSVVKGRLWGMETIRDAAGEPLSAEDRQSLGLAPQTEEAVSLSTFLRHLEALLHEQAR